MSERLENNTSENSDWLDQWNELADRKRIDKFKENAAQELIERELNSELTKVDDLFNAVRAHEKGIKGTRATLNFDNGEQGNVTLFVLEGYPLKILQSSISIYNTNDLANNDEYGQTHQTVDQLIEDPSFWMKKQNEVEGLGKSTSAVLSASYFDTNIGITDMTGMAAAMLLITSDQGLSSKSIKETIIRFLNQKFNNQNLLPMNQMVIPTGHHILQKILIKKKNHQSHSKNWLIWKHHSSTIIMN